MIGDKLKIPTQNVQGWLELTSFLTVKVISGWPVLLVEETGEPGVRSDMTLTDTSTPYQEETGVPRGNNQHT